jgi:hypothetical protein
MELKQLKQELKALGFKVSIRSQSYGRHVTYIHIATNEALTFNVFTPERLERWTPLCVWQIDNSANLASLYKEEKIYGLTNMVK